MYKYKYIFIYMVVVLVTDAHVVVVEEGSLDRRSFGVVTALESDSLKTVLTVLESDSLKIRFLRMTLVWSCCKVWGVVFMLYGPGYSAAGPFFPLHLVVTDEHIVGVEEGSLDRRSFGVRGDFMVFHFGCSAVAIAPASYTLHPDPEPW